MTAYRFVSHITFVEQFEEFKKNADKKCLKSFLKQLEKSVLDPFNAGSTFHVDTLDLKGGMIYKLYVGSNKDYRYFYYVNKKELLVMALYLTSVPRKKFDYNEFDIGGKFTEIFSDHKDRNYARFIRLNLPN